MTSAWKAKAASSGHVTRNARLERAAGACRVAVMSRLAASRDGHSDMVVACASFRPLAKEINLMNDRGSRRYCRPVPQRTSNHGQSQDHIVDPKKLEYGPRTICAGCPSSQGFGVGAQSFPNFLASTAVLQDFNFEPGPCNLSPARRA